jgi:hypothetical protein
MSRLLLIFLTSISVLLLSPYSFAETADTSISNEERINKIDNFTRSTISSMDKKIELLSEDLGKQAENNIETLKNIITLKDAEQETNISEQFRDIESNYHQEIRQLQRELGNNINENSQNQINFLLQILGIAIAVFLAVLPFALTYFRNLVSNAVEVRAVEHVTKHGRSEQATLHDIHANMAYQQYIRNTDINNKNFYLDRAIKYESLAIEAIESIPEKDRPDYLWARINNNFAMFLLYKGEDQYKQKILSAAKVAYNSSKSKPNDQQWYRWQETYAQILLKWGSEKEKLNAKQIIQSLCDDKSIPDLFWKREKYGIYKKLLENLHVEDLNVTSN